MTDDREAARRAVESLAEQGALNAADIRRLNDRRTAALVAAQAAGRRWDNLPGVVEIPPALLEKEKEAQAQAEESGTTLEGAAQGRPSTGPRMALLPHGRTDDLTPEPDYAAIAKAARDRF